MKYPKHLILDYGLTFKKECTPYWGLRYALVNNHQLSLVHNIFLKGKKSPKKKTPKSFRSLALTPSYASYDIFFLRKEKIYTKLKYSRCPQYDIVSGGAAALLAGFIGFLITEKFGLELLDSGDFYFAFMYGVFISFSVRPLIRLLDKDILKHRAFSLKPLYLFLSTIILLLVKFISFLLGKYTPYLVPTVHLIVKWCFDNESIRPTISWFSYWIAYWKNYPRGEK